MAPSTTIAGASSIVLPLYGSNFASGAAVEWNGTQLVSAWISAEQMTAIVSTNQLSAAGSAQVTVVNPSPGGGTSAGQTSTRSSPVPAPATTWIRNVPGITVPNDIVWDGAHGNLYASVSSTDPTNPNATAIINPADRDCGINYSSWKQSRPAFHFPGFILFVGRPSMEPMCPALPSSRLPHKGHFFLSATKPLRHPCPSRESAGPLPRVRHTVALVSGNWGESPPGNGIYIYDDATQRPTFVPGSWTTSGMPFMDWIEWSGNDSTILRESRSLYLKCDICWGPVCYE